MRKQPFLIGGVLAGLVALLIVGSVVIAQEASVTESAAPQQEAAEGDTHADKEGGKDAAYADKKDVYADFVARVAEILGEDEETVRSAMDQARQEIHDEMIQRREQAAMDRLQAWLDAAVEAEKITQDEAEAYLQWHADRPEGIGAGYSPHHHGKAFKHRGWRR